MKAPASTFSAATRTSVFGLVSLYVALLVLVAAALSALLIWQTNALLSDHVARALTTERGELLAIAQTRGLPVLAANIAERARSGGETLYLLGDAQGNRLAGTFQMLPDELRDGQRSGLFHYRTADGADRLAAGVTAVMPGGAHLVIARDVEDQKRLAERLRTVFFWGLGIFAVAGLGGGVLLGRILLGRIDTINAAAEAIMAGQLSHRIPLAGSGDEIDELAGNLNRMLERIEQLMAGLREVSDNIAHDLKTPLTRLRSRAEAALRDPVGGAAWREGLERTLEDADQLIRTFNALLLIARLEAGALEQSVDTFDLAEVVRDVAELYEPVAEEAHLALDVDAAHGPKLRANRELIGQAVANLIDNAIKYSRGTACRDPIAVTLAEAPDAIEIRVADHGPGIPASDRERALKRFVRLDASRTTPGTGLGLNLVAAVARMHGGSVRLGDNAPGLVVTLVLPRSRVVPA